MSCKFDPKSISENIKESVYEQINSKKYRIIDDVIKPLDGSSTSSLPSDLEQINKSFLGYDIISPSANGFKIEIPEQLSWEYIIRTPESGPFVVDYIRRSYRKMAYSDKSQNLLSDELWITDPLLASPSVQKLLNFMKKVNPNARVQEVDNLDVNAVSLIKDNIILIRSGYIMEELPEEVAHFYLALAPDDILSEMKKDIINYKIYSETYNIYKNNPAYQKDGKPNIDKIKLEASAKLISKLVKEKWDDPSSKDSFFLQLLRKLIRFLRKQIRRITNPSSESLFDHAAESILTEDLSMLNVNKVQDPYNLVFFSAIEENVNDFQSSELTKTIYSFAKAMNSHLKQLFKEEIKNSPFQGLKEALEEKEGGNFNKLFYIRQYADEALEQLKSFNESDTKTKIAELRTVVSASYSLAYAYQTMEVIPTAIEKAIKDLKSKGSMNKVVDDIRELVAYFKFSRNTLAVMDTYTDLLNKIKQNEEFADLGTGNNMKKVYEDMLSIMGSARNKINQNDELIINELRKHIEQVVFDTIGDDLERWDERWEEKESKLTHMQHRMNVARQRAEKISNMNQIKEILSGEFTVPFLPDGSSADISRLKDLTAFESTLALLASPTLIPDPLISTLVKNHLTEMTKGEQEGRMASRRFFAGENEVGVSPIKEKLISQHKMKYYEIDKIIFSEEDFVKENGETMKRQVLLTDYNRAKMNADLALLSNQRRTISSDIYKLNKKLEGQTDQSKIDNIKNQIEKLKLELDQINSKKKEIQEKYRYRVFTDYYYNKVTEIQNQKGDTETLKLYRSLRKEILELQQELSRMQSSFVDLSDPLMVETISKLGYFTAKLASLELNGRPKELAEEEAKMYEVDVQKTMWNVRRHRETWVKKVYSELVAKGLSKEDADKLANDNYKYFFTPLKLTQAYYDKIKAIRDQIDSYVSSTDQRVIHGIKALKSTIDALTERKRKLLKPFRDQVNRVSILAMTGSPETVKELNQIEELLQIIWKTFSNLRNLEKTIQIMGETSIDPQSNTNYEIFDSTYNWINFLFTFQTIGVSPSIISEKDSIAALKQTLTNSDQELVKIIENIRTMLNSQTGAVTALDDLKKLVKFRSTTAQARFYNFANELSQGAEGSQRLIENAYRALSMLSSWKKDGPEDKKVTELYQELNDLTPSVITYEYKYLLERVFLRYYEIYTQLNGDDSYSDQYLLYREQEGILLNVDKLKSLFKNGMFQSVIDFMQNPSKNFIFSSNVELSNDDIRSKLTREGFPDHPYDLQVRKTESAGVFNYNVKATLKNVPVFEDMTLFQFADFFSNLHKPVVFKSDTGFVSSMQPNKFASEIEADSFIEENETSNEFVEESVAPFLRRSRVKDEVEVTENGEKKIVRLRTEILNELHPDVISGQKLPTVDINGRWLPKPIGPESPYYNKRYFDLQNSSSDKDKLLFKLLNYYKLEYLKAQDSVLNEEERLDIVIPTKTFDNYEQKARYIERKKLALEHLYASIPFKNKEGEMAKTILKEIGAQTAESRNIYSGLKIRDKQPKMFSMSPIDISRQTEDIGAAIAQFIEESHLFTAKKVVSPLFEGMNYVLKSTFMDGSGNIINPSINRKRSSVIDDLHNTKILNEVPQSFWNNKNIAEILRISRVLSVNRLLLDPLGALVNLGSGTITNLIQMGWDKNEYSSYLKVTPSVISWLTKYSVDYINKENVSLESQIIETFNMIPEERSPSRQASRIALAASLRSHGMVPRTLTEQELGIHMGLALLDAEESIMINGKAVKVIELYEKGKDNIIKLKDEYSSLSEDWNPIDGKKVKQLRLKIMQKYIILQGNFYRDTQSYISNFAGGKAAETMKRWFISGLYRSWMPETADYYSGQPSYKGYHLAMLHFLKTTFKAAFTLDSVLFKEEMSVMLDSLEKKRLQQSLMNMMYLVAHFIILSAFLGYDDDDPDRNKKLKAMSYAEQLAILLAVRTQGELGTFIPLPFYGLGFTELKRNIFDPLSLINSSGIGGLSGILVMLGKMLVYNLGAESMAKDIFYQKDLGYNSELNQFLGYKQKGALKLWTLIYNAFGYTGYTADPAPYIITYQNLQNRYK